MRVLVVEDSSRLRRTLERGLRRVGFAVDSAQDGQSGQVLAEVNDYDVIVLDLMLPAKDGLSVLRDLRRRGKKTHVLIVSAKDQVEDRIKGLNLGADDYLAKPFAFGELVARIHALVRRRYETKDPIICVGPLEINTTLRRVTRDGREIELTPGEYSLLDYLARRRGRVLPREHLMHHLHDGEAKAASNVIDVLVCSLRRKIQVDGEPPIVRTRRGFGYVIE